jgi:hypothetical protein
MSARVDQIVTTAVVESLENMAFMEVLAASEETLQSVTAEAISVKQQILAPVQGEFHLLMPRPLVAIIAETIFTMAIEEVTEQQQEDVATELLNTIAGRFLNDYLPADEIYKLSLPAIEMAGVGEPDHQVRTWSFQMAELPFTFTMTETLLEKDNARGETGGQS